MKIKEFSKKQGEILKFIFRPETALICDGAVRSGKTVVMIMSFVMWAMESFNKCNFAICSKTVSNAERNVLRPLQGIEGLPYTLSYKTSSRMLTVKCGSKENYFYLFGGKDESSYALIQGITLAGVFLDEVALMPRSFVDQAIARTLTFPNAKIWFNCNPESPMHWFYTDWVLKYKEKNAVHLHFLMTDNPILSEKDIEEAGKKFDGVFYKRYILGQWVVAEGAIYKIFAENKEKYFTDNPDYDFIQVGIDFGGNKSAHTFVASGIKKDGSKLTVLMSERHEAKGLSPDDLYKLLNAFITKVKNKYGDIYMLYADCAEQTLINGMRANCGISVRDSIKNPIIDRIRCTTGLMSSGRFFMTHDCESLEKAFESAVYDDKKLDDVRLDNGTSDIDTLDAFEYSFERFINKYVR